MTTPAKRLRVAALDIGGCEGCTVSILRALATLERFADVHMSYLGNLDLNAEYDVVLVCGPVCVNKPEKIELVKSLREKARLLIAYGSCASVGGVARFARGGQEPRPDHRVYKPVTSVVKVDYAIPGCPPAPQTVQALLASIQRGPTPLLRVFAAVARVEKLSGFDLLDDVVLPGLCIGCGACILSCPTGALQMVEGRPDLAVEKCIRCGTCYVRCPRASQVLVARLARGAE